MTLISRQICTMITFDFQKVKKRMCSRLLFSPPYYTIAWGKWQPLRKEVGPRTGLNCIYNRQSPIDVDFMSPSVKLSSSSKYNLNWSINYVKYWLQPVTAYGPLHACIKTLRFLRMAFTSMMLVSNTTINRLKIFYSNTDRLQKRPHIFL